MALATEDELFPSNCSVGYASPLEAMEKGPKEKLLYVTCVQPYSKEDGKPDYLATVDVDPYSSSYCKIIHRLRVTNVGDELHHTGWNVCTSCTLSKKCRNRLIMPSLVSDNIYIVDTGTDPREPCLHKVVKGEELHSFNVGAPHTVHCVASGDVMISCMGDKNGNAQGAFILLDGKSFDIKERWEKSGPVGFGYDFWYQPRRNVMVSTSWGPPKIFRKGFDPAEISDYGTFLYIWDWEKRTLEQTIDLGSEGIMPLEVRFLHNPTKNIGFVGAALSSIVHKFSKDEVTGKWVSKPVITVPSVECSYWLLPSMPGLITDVIISLDDKFLYFSNWLHGDVRQYNIEDPDEPKLTGQVFLGGCLYAGGPVKLPNNAAQNELTFVKDKPIRGAPQMLQLSLDGKRLYVTTSLFSVWDKQFYQETAKCGSMMFQLDCEKDGGMKINPDFCVDFGSDGSPVLAHEMRYPGGDCTSDIWC